MPPAPKLTLVSPAAPAWDKSQALERLANDAELLNDLVQIFLVEYPAQTETLRQALAVGDLEVATRVAHTIKGEVSQLCATPTTEAARLLEEAGRAGEPAKMSLLMPPLEHCGTALCRELTLWLENSP